ncbi:MAG TPA: NAD(P)H-dependent oxidoreductase [Sporichthyaceae bacterium]
MNLFRLDTSLRTTGSTSREVADTAEAAWLAEHPDGQVVRRDLGTDPLLVTDWMQAVAGSPEAAKLAATLADELLDADAIIVGTALYNFGVPAQLKTWVDLLITDPRFGPGAEQPLAGRPAILIVARGGGYGPGTPREGWDHATPWVQRVLGDVFGLDVKLVEAELTMAPVVPAMEALRAIAEQNRQDAHSAADTHGRALVRNARDRAA